jgi:hypothetical protein
MFVKYRKRTLCGIIVNVAVQGTGTQVMSSEYLRDIPFRLI